jgi:hypothetical protein
MYTRLNSNALKDDGSTRSSDEAFVIRVEPGSSVMQLMMFKQLEKG